MNKIVKMIDEMIERSKRGQYGASPERVRYTSGRLDALSELRAKIVAELEIAPALGTISEIDKWEPRKPNRIHLAPRKQLVDLASDYINHEYPRPVDGHIALENVNSCDKHHITDWRNRKYPHSQDLRHEYYIGIDDKKLERLIKDVEREAKRKRIAAQGTAR